MIDLIVAIIWIIGAIYFTLRWAPRVADFFTPGIPDAGDKFMGLFAAFWMALFLWPLLAVLIPGIPRAVSFVDRHMTTPKERAERQRYLQTGGREPTEEERAADRRRLNEMPTIHIRLDKGDT